jgi:hypothetical protein
MHQGLGEEVVVEGLELHSQCADVTHMEGHLEDKRRSHWRPDSGAPSG